MRNSLEKEVQRELEYLDLELFLDYDRHPAYGFLYYSVKRMMPNAAPLTVVDWCVGSTPLPLSLDIVDRVRSQEGDIRESITAATVNNAARKELQRQERLKQQEEVIEEWQKSGRSTGIPAESSIVVSKDIGDAQNRG